MAFLSKLAYAGLLVPGFLMAGTIASCTSITSLQLPALTMTGVTASTQTENTSINWQVNFVTLGPEQFNAPDNFLQSFTVTGQPASGWVYDPLASGLTSYGSDGAVIVTFDDENQDGLNLGSVEYEAYGTDAFWAKVGGPFAFGSTEDTAATSGAFFNFNSSLTNTEIDPVCTQCSVVTTASAAPGAGLSNPSGTRSWFVPDVL